MTGANASVATEIALTNTVEPAEEALERVNVTGILTLENLLERML